MHSKWHGIAITILFVPGVGMSQDCREAELNDETAVAHYLRDHKSNSTAADKYCGYRAFSALAFATKFKDRNYIWLLAKMLDCERSTPVGYKEAAEPKYPALDELEWLNGAGKNVVLSLVKEIKESESEVLRENAAETLRRVDPGIASRVLSPVAEGVIPYEQKEWLEAAERIVAGVRTRGT